MLAVVFAVCLGGIALTLGAAWYAYHVLCPRAEAALIRRFRPLLVNDAGESSLPTEAAENRARELLYSKLDPAQRRSWILRRAFVVRAASGHRYLVSQYRPFNIRTHDAVFCLQVAGPAPACDKLLAQKLLIEANETLFLATANVRTFSSRWERTIAAARAKHALPPACASHLAHP